MTHGRLVALMGLFGLAFALAFAVRTGLRGFVDPRSQAFALAGALCLAGWAWLDGAPSPHRPRLRGRLLLGAVAALAVIEGTHRADLVVDASLRAAEPLPDAVTHTLGTLDPPLEIVAAFRHGSTAQQRMRRQLARWTQAGATVRWIDPLRSPQEAARLGLQREHGELVLRQGTRSLHLVGTLDDDALDAAMDRMLTSRPRTLCWATDHGEPGPDDLRSPEGFGRAVLALERLAWAVRPVRLSEGPPKDCDVVGVIAPTAPLGEVDRAALTAIPDGVGVLVLVDPGEAPGLEDAAEAWGITMGDGVVLAGDDASIRLGAQDPALLVLGPSPAIRTHPATAALGGRLVFAMARPVDGDGGALLTVDAGGIAPTDPSDVPRPGGPTPIAALGDPARPRPVIVVGDAGFATNRGIGVGPHRDLWLDLLALAAGEPARGPRPARATAGLVLNRQDGTWLALLAWVGVPGAVVGMGAATLARHRRRSRPGDAR